MSEIKTFDPAALASLTTGTVLIEPFKLVQDVAEWVLGYSVFTHELPKLSNKIRAAILAQFPDMPVGTVDERFTEVRDAVRARYGEAVAVKRGGDKKVTPLPDQSKAAQDVLAERRRQIEVEGWTPDHDDAHRGGEMAEAAACYLLALRQYSPDPCTGLAYERDCCIKGVWPWHGQWLNRQGPRRDLVKAGALILAEIERLDRLHQP